MQYLDSLVQKGAQWQNYTDKLLALEESIHEGTNGVPEYTSTLDSLLKIKSELLVSKILDLQGKSSSKLDSAGLIFPINISNQGEMLEEVNQHIHQYTSQITDPQELVWLQDHIGQLNQLESVLQEYQGKVLELSDLQQLQSYQEQLQSLMGQSQGYFQEMKSVLEGGLSEDSPFMSELQSKIGLSKEFQELQAKTAELEQFKAISQKYGQDYALKNRQEARQRLLDHAKEIGAKAFEQHQEKVQEVQDKFQKLKKKYRSLGDARDLSTGVKRSSLKDEPFKKKTGDRWHHANSIFSFPATQ